MAGWAAHQNHSRTPRTPGNSYWMCWLWSEVIGCVNEHVLAKLLRGLRTEPKSVLLTSCCDNFCHTFQPGVRIVSGIDTSQPLSTHVIVSSTLGQHVSLPDLCLGPHLGVGHRESSSLVPRAKPWPPEHSWLDLDKTQCFSLYLLSSYRA